MKRAITGIASDLFCTMNAMEIKSAKLITDPEISVFFLPMKSASPPPIRLKTMDVTEKSVKIIPTTEIGIPKSFSK
jgi:hypothetical protein